MERGSLVAALSGGEIRAVVLEGFNGGDHWWLSTMVQER
jgi:hypothetical protein